MKISSENEQSVRGGMVFQGPLNGGVSNGGGFPIPDFFVLFCPFSEFISRFFRDFPGLLAEGPGIFPISPFPLSRPIIEHLRGTVPKGSATQSGPFPK